VRSQTFHTGLLIRSGAESSRLFKAYAFFCFILIVKLEDEAVFVWSQMRFAAEQQIGLYQTDPQTTQKFMLSVKEPLWHQRKMTNGYSSYNLTMQYAPVSIRLVPFVVQYERKTRNAWQSQACNPLARANIQQEAFQKCWAHSPLRAAARPNFTLPFTRCRYCRTPSAPSTTTTTTTTRDRADRYGPVERAQ